MTRPAGPHSGVGGGRSGQHGDGEVGRQRGRPSGFLQLDISNAAFVDSGVVRGADSLVDGMPVFAQSSGKAGERGQSVVCKVVQPAWQGRRVTVVEHGGEPADKVVGVPEFRALVEEPGQATLLCGPLRSGWVVIQRAASHGEGGRRVARPGAGPVSGVRRGRRITWFQGRCRDGSIGRCPHRPPK